MRKVGLPEFENVGSYRPEHEMPRLLLDTHWAAKHFNALALLLGLLVTATELRAEERSAPLYRNLRRAALEVLVAGRLEGSGVIVDPEGLAVTALHVLGDPGKKLETRSPIAGRQEVEVLAVDEAHDLALLRLPTQDKPYPAVPLAKQVPAPGEEVYLFGTPVFRHAVLLRGAMAREQTTFEWVRGRWIEVLHVSSLSPAGTSGGPWVNPQGELVGVQSSLLCHNRVPLGLAFISPLDSIAQLIEERAATVMPSMGSAVEELWTQSPEFLQQVKPGVTGLVIRQLQVGGPADQAELINGEIIQTLDGQLVQVTDDFVRALWTKKPGDELTLTVLSAQGVRPRQVQLTLTHSKTAWTQALTESAEK